MKGVDIMFEVFMTGVIGFAIIVVVAALWWIALMWMSD